MAINITKFFRKYNKAMLAVFTIFLMVAFLLPASLKELFSSHPNKRVLGEAFGKTIHAYDLQKVSQETQTLGALNQFNSQNSQQGQPFPWEYFVAMAPTEQERLIDYYLLVEEARRMGIKVSPEQADRALSERRIPPQIINAILQGNQIPLRGLRDAVADFLSVESAFELAASAVKVSNPELEHMFKLTNDKVKVAILPVPAASFVKDVAKPSENVLADYFTQNKNKFRYPDRIQVEYLGVDVAQAKNAIEISREKARDYWTDHKAEYTKTVHPPASQPKKGTTAPASKPAPIQVQLTFEEALPQVMDKLKTERAKELAKKAMYDAKEQAERFWRNVPADKSGVKQKPEKVADYQQLADQISKDDKIKIIYHRTPLIGQDEVNDLPGIAQSFIPEQRRPLYFGEYAFRVIPLVQPPAGKSRDQSAFIVPYQNVGLLRNMTREGDETGFYLFRVIKVDPSHLPANLAEIKDKVQQDYLLNQAYVIAKKNAEAICQAAGKQTLSDLVKSPSGDAAKVIKQLGVKTIEPQTFAQQTFSYGGRMVPPTIPQVRGNTAQFADMTFEKLWKQPTTQPDGKRTCAVVTDDAGRTAYTVQLLEKIPATQTEFNQFKGFASYFMQRTKQQEFARSWFAPESLHKRTNFVSKLSDEEMAE